MQEESQSQAAADHELSTAYYASLWSLRKLCTQQWPARGESARNSVEGFSLIVLLAGRAATATTFPDIFVSVASLSVFADKVSFEKRAFEFAFPL